MTDAKVALVIGAGDATGGAIARRFAREGLTACVVRRNADKLVPLVERIEAAGGRARAFGTDARKEEAMVALVDSIEREIGAIEIAVFNVGGKSAFRSAKPPPASITRSGRWPASRASCSAARPHE
jgi:NAD(P)-dependent dehydrogenase (short-subunit alcohol dehydrogenase family)